MSKSRSSAAEPITNEELAEALQVIAQAAQAQAASTVQIMQFMQQMSEMMRQAQAGGQDGLGGVTLATSRITIWEDDPFSEESPTRNPTLSPTIAVQVPVNNNTLLQTRITEPAVTPGEYSPGTANFRFWVAAEALARGINFWAGLLPSGTQWTTVNKPMGVGLDSGDDLNAFYSRTAGLRFFHRVVRNVAIFSAESADVVCHELGHAILDALRPQLFDAASLEVAAFHESFGDMSGILSSLQLPTLRRKVLEETNGRLNTNSRLSRLAEQLGWGIRQLSSTAVDQDSLRNAANRFSYQDPRLLPARAPASQLSSESHSFSRVFTGAFLDILARMLSAVGPPSEQSLQTVSRDMGQLLVNGIRTAPITPGYYSQVAAAMIQADRVLFEGRYRTALATGFIRRGILAADSLSMLEDAPLPKMAATVAAGNGHSVLTYGDDDDAHTRAAEDAPALPTRSVTTLSGLTIKVHAPAEPPRFTVASSVAVDDGKDRTAVDDAAAFVNELMQFGRIDVAPIQGGAAAAMHDLPVVDDGSRKSHTLVRDEHGAIVLKRLYFDCGLHECDHGC
ncbi:Fungalysin metallopeptidase (M36) [Singulisphaera sp. GP187]|uniref:M36 family metallopeptidase n=1 Tax=Singulisphaera sp. GP187 TaxID=1882752 RepID=UPI000926D04F|nr:M36 family metallopeptidase [Singulisphaera sp. GP187]SIO23771.1 Fungalysin metallopeptidase (M36) [Singulisphaera sp. GP187]